MHRTNHLLWPAVAAVLLGPATWKAAAQGQVELKPIKYQELGKLVRGLKGKVVVVDFWADF